MINKIISSIFALALMAACSETPLEEQNEEELAETETQIGEDARSLEEAAAEAVKALEEEIEADLQDEGIALEEPEPATSEEGSGE